MPQATPGRPSAPFLMQWVILTSALLTLAATLAFFGYREHQEVAILQGDRLRTPARVLAANLDQQLESVHQALLGVRQDWPAWNLTGDWETAARRLKALSDAMPGVRAMVITDSRGVILASDRAEFLGRDFSGRKYFQQARQRQDPVAIHLSPPFRGPLGGFVMGLSMMLPGPQDEFAGVVAASLDPNFFGALLEPVRYAPDMFVAIAHGDGQLFLMNPPRPDLDGINLAVPGSFFSRHRDSGDQESLLTGVVYTTGEERMMALRTVKPASVPLDKPLQLAVSRDLHAMYASWRRDMWIQGLAFLLLALGAVGGLNLYQRRQRQYLDQALAAGERLRQKTEELEVYFRNSLDLLCIADTDGFFRRLNPEWEKALGYPLSELEGKRFLDFVHPEDLEPTLAAMGELERGETVFKFVNRYRRRDGSYRWIEWRSFPMGQMIFANARDITLPLQAEQARLESERRYRELFDGIDDFIYTHDLDGNVLDINMAACRGLGRRREELLGTCLGDVMAPEFRQAFFDEYLTQVIAQGRRDGIAKYMAKDGSARYIEYRNRVIREEGKEAYVSGSGRDVTERVKAEREMRRLEEQLLRSQKIEAVGVLAGGIAHDFNNVLQAISGYAQLLLSETGVSPVGRERLESIERAIERAARMITQLMTMAHKVETRRERVDLNQEVRGTVDLLEHTLPRMIALRTSLDPELRPIDGDPGQVEQVLLNLANNAAQAMPQGGVLSFTTANATLSAEDCKAMPGLRPGHHVRLEVADTGLGMDEQTLSRIFEPFFTTKAPGEGTGLGLSTVYGIVANHGGHITCRSRPNQGTAFTIHLPAAISPPPRADEDAPGAAFSAPGHETILLVDDEPLILDACREALQAHGYRVLTAARGEEALAIFLADPAAIALVIMDLNMPGMGGLDCMKAMLAAHPRTRVMAATGYAEPGILDTILAMGGVGLLPKPYRFADLLASIRLALDRR